MSDNGQQLAMFAIGRRQAWSAVVYVRDGQPVTLQASSLAEIQRQVVFCLRMAGIPIVGGRWGELPTGEQCLVSDGQMVARVTRNAEYA